MAGCALVANMPSQGLGEALGSLKEIWEYWQVSEERKLLPTAPVETTGRVVRAGVRPDLILAE